MLLQQFIFAVAQIGMFFTCNMFPVTNPLKTRSTILKLQFCLRIWNLNETAALKNLSN